MQRKAPVAGGLSLTGQADSYGRNWLRKFLEYVVSSRW